jgi:hypothetical protein
MPQPRLRRPAESSGQPSPAGIEPGPFERAEAERAAADDGLRERMGEEAHEGRAEGIAGAPPLEWHQPAELKQYRLMSGQYRHTITAAGNVPIGGANQLPFPEEIRAGMIFVIRAIRALAPAGAKLQLYQDNVTPTNFREVVTNVQEYSGEVPGELVIRGASRLIAMITGTSAEGLAVIRLEGDLVQREPVAL